MPAPALVRARVFGIRAGMRQGRFAGLGAAGHGAVTPPGVADLFLFDFRACEDEEGERVAAERARSLALSVPFLAVSHLLWAIVLLLAIVREGLEVDWAATGAPLAGALAV